MLSFKKDGRKIEISIRLSEFLLVIGCIVLRERPNKIGNTTLRDFPKGRDYQKLKDELATVDKVTLNLLKDEEAK